MASKDEDVKKPHPRSIMDTEKFILTLGGIYPKKVPTILYNCGFCVTLFFSLGLFTVMFVDLFIETDLSEIINILYYFPQQAAYVGKLINFIAKAKKIERIEEIFDDVRFNSHKEHQYRHLNEAIAKTRLVANFFRLLCCLVVLFYALPPVFETEFKIPLPGWYPFDVDANAFLIYVFEVTAVFVSATINSNIDILDVRLISLGSAQLDVLMDNLENLIVEDEAMLFDRRTLDAIAEERLKGIARHHQMILEYINCVEDIFTYGIFCQFILCMMVICMTGFNMLMVTIPSWDFALLMIFFSCMMNQIALYCWYGNDMIVKSSAIVDASFAAKWYECSPNIGKFLCIIMERSKRPIRLTAGYFFALSLVTLMSLLRSSYSYFAVLQRMYTKE